MNFLISFIVCVTSVSALADNQYFNAEVELYGEPVTINENIAIKIRYKVPCFASHVGTQTFSDREIVSGQGEREVSVIQVLLKAANNACLPEEADFEVVEQDVFIRSSNVRLVSASSFKD